MLSCDTTLLSQFTALSKSASGASLTSLILSYINKPNFYSYSVILEMVEEGEEVREFLKSFVEGDVEKVLSSPLRSKIIPSGLLNLLSITLLSHFHQNGLGTYPLPPLLAHLKSSTSDAEFQSLCNADEVESIFVKCLYANAINKGKVKHVTNDGTEFIVGGPINIPFTSSFSFLKTLQIKVEDEIERVEVLKISIEKEEQEELQKDEEWIKKKNESILKVKEGKDGKRKRVKVEKGEEGF